MVFKETKIKNIKMTDAKLSGESNAIQTSNFIHLTSAIYTTEPLKEEILKGSVHSIDEMKAWLQPFGYSDSINDAAINFILREFVMSKVPSGSLCNAEMIVELFRPQLEHQTSYFSHQPSLRLYH